MPLSQLTISMDLPSPSVGRKAASPVQSCLARGVVSTLQSNTNEVPIAAARSGWGLTRVLHYQIGPDLLEGRLRIVLDEYEEAPIPVHVLYPEGRRAPAKVRTFVDLAVSQLRANRTLN